MADLSVNGVQASATNGAGKTDAAAKTKNKAKTSLFQAQSGDAQNVKSTETQREKFNTSTLASDYSTKTTYNDGSYSVSYRDGKTRIYSPDGKWISGTTSQGLSYTNTYTDDGCTCTYADGSEEYYDADNKVLKGAKDKDGSIKYFANGNPSYVTEGITSDADGNRHYTITRTTSADKTSTTESQQFDDGQRIDTYKNALGEFRGQRTFNSDGSSVTLLPDNSEEYRDKNDVITGGKTASGIEYQNTYSDSGKLAQTTYSNGNIRTYNEDNTQVLHDKDDKWIGGKNETLGEYSVKYGDNGEYTLSNARGASVTYDKDGRPLSGQDGNYQGDDKWTNTYNSDGTVTTNHKNGAYEIRDNESGRILSGRVADGPEYTMEYNADGSFVAKYSTGDVVTYDKEGHIIDQKQNEIEEMKYKDAKAWVQDYMAKHNCSEEEAKTNFAQINGYEMPLSTGQKIGKVFKSIGKVAGQVGLVVLEGLAMATKEAAHHYSITHGVLPPPPTPHHHHHSHRNV